MPRNANMGRIAGAKWNNPWAFISGVGIAFIPDVGIATMGVYDIIMMMEELYETGCCNEFSPQ